MMSDPWAAKLSDYLDGELTDAERSALERHLDACPSCTAALDQLARVIDRARRLPSRAPANDLGPVSRRGSGPRRSVPDAPPRKRRRWTFSLPELAAACLAVAMVSGGGVWFVAGEATHQ